MQLISFGKEDIGSFNKSSAFTQDFNTRAYTPEKKPSQQFSYSNQKDIRREAEISWGKNYTGMKE